MAMEQSYDNKKLDTYALIKASVVEDSIMGTSAMLSKYMQKENWSWANWDRMEQADKEAKLEELMTEIEEWDAEKMAEMDGEMKEEMSEDEEAEEDAEEEDAEEEDADEEETDEEEVAEEEAEFDE